MPAQTDTHVELELRYMRPDGFQVPACLAGLELAGFSRAVHRDHYFDGIGADGKAALRAARCSLRIRQDTDGNTVATFKERAKDPGPGGAAARLETEAALDGPAAGPEMFTHAANSLSHPALDAARAAAGPGVRLMELFTVTNDRRNHAYEGPAGRLMLSEDYVRYPDGSGEQRIEVELHAGKPKLLRKAARELARQFPEMQAAERGKLSTARERMAALLGC